MDFSKAGFLRRFVALCLDIFILDIVGILITYPLHKKFDVELDDLADFLMTGIDISHPIVLFFLLYTTLITILWGFYFTFFIGWVGQTPGKKIMKIRVDRSDGKPMDYATAFQRFVGLTVSASVFGIGFLWALFDKEQKTWHDKMAHTIVVNVS